MIIPISKKQRITGTEHSWQVEKLHTPAKEGKEPYWAAFKYYTSFEDALTQCCLRDIRLHPAQGVSEAIQACTEVTKRYSAIFDTALESASQGTNHGN